MIDLVCMSKKRIYGEHKGCLKNRLQNIDLNSSKDTYKILGLCELLDCLEKLPKGTYSFMYYLFYAGHFGFTGGELDTILQRVSDGFEKGEYMTHNKYTVQEKQYGKR